MNRKDFISLSSMGLLSLTVQNKPGSSGKQFRAILFDGFVIFNPAPLVNLVNQLFPSTGSSFITTWREKQFQYTWLRVSGEMYIDFWKVTRDALQFAARKNAIVLSKESEDILMNQYLKLPLWPDVKPVLATLQKEGMILGILSNFTYQMLESCLEKADEKKLFSKVISTDSVKSYKPSKATYQLGIEKTGFKKSEILFVGFAGWDVSGADWFGYPVYWLNRAGAPAEELGNTEVESGKNMQELAAWLSRS